MEDGLQYTEGDRGLSRSLGPKKFGSTASASFITVRTSSPFFDANPIEHQKKRSLKKIIELASIDPEVVKCLRRLLGIGFQAIDEKGRLRLREKAEEVMEEDRLHEFENLMAKVMITRDTSYSTILSLFKLFIVSSEERNYVERIDEELMRSLELDRETEEINEKLGLQRQKRSKSNAVQESAESLRREIEQYENKIEKANQKLNQALVNNEELRKKVDQLRRDRVLIDQVYARLEKEMIEKQEEIEDTIKNAGEAYLKKDKTEEELRMLNHQSEENKEMFFNELKEINKNIEEDRHFKQFIFNKNKGRKDLENLEAAIVKNENKILEKQRNNALMEKEYNISAKKEEAIRKAFEKMQQGTGVHAPQDVVIVFNGLYQRVKEMEGYVRDLTAETAALDERIEGLKRKMRSYSLKGVRYANAKDAEMMLKKLEVEDRKRKEYKAQYRKYIETLSEHKERLMKLFETIGADEKIRDKVKNSTFTEQNIMEFIGLLEQKGMKLINRFSRLVAQQMILEKGSAYNLDAQLEDLNDIVAYDNASTMKLKSERKHVIGDAPDEAFTAEVVIDKDNVMTEDQFKYMAFSLLSSVQKRSPSPIIKKVVSGKGKFNVIKFLSASKGKKE